MRETIRVQHSEFFTGGPEVDIDVETWYCCRPWPIVVSSTTYTPGSDTWKREAWFVRKCGYCHEYPRPQEEIQ